MITSGPDALTRTFAVLGDPVAHSLSPRIHNAAIRSLGLNAVYVALRCTAAGVAPLMRALGEAGGGGSVTVPHKPAAAGALDRPTDLVLRTGACNAFWMEAGLLCGDNTDVAGFRHAARRLVPTLRGTSVLVLGAGGAAAAALCALIDEEAAAITLLNRDPARATALAARLDPRHLAVEVAGPRDAAGREFDLVVNATSLGLGADDPLPCDLSRVRTRAVLDLVYHAGGVTPWVRAARALGVAAEDGSEMLLAQAAVAFRHWFGLEAPLDVMRAALRSSD
jgi:shikimate dehydrogenase